ncbi:TonB-dependent receptor [Filimonas effusa]|uniref:TonB-dependent receptor n=2 Tax=Filimonas effusa TaxID=2508721 RepID=A0A4Q1DA19_9BACT|nr:TonB-dependent receptor [Filimonas effusa]
MKQKKQKMKNRLLLFFTFLLMTAFGVNAQDLTVKGSVKDAENKPVIGANIQVEGNAAIGTVSDENGNFSLKVPNGTKSLTISFLGMQSQQVEVVAGRLLTVFLKEEAKKLDDVVVVGYQTVRRKDLTGSVASVSGKSISTMPVANAAQALQGKLPGVNVVTQDGRPGGAVSIRIRGGSSISQSNDPLVLIDGVAGSLNDIPADQIESIDVLKDASSTAIYGARGANGVILVTTKMAKEGRIATTYNGFVKVNTPTGYLQALNPYDYLKYVWANAAANGAAYQTPFEKLFGLGANAGTNAGGIERYRNTPMYDNQRDVYKNSTSHNHDVSVSGGTNKTKVLFAANYIDEQGMKLNSYLKRANVSFKANQKLSDKVDVNIDTRYTDVKDFGNDGAILSMAYRFRPIGLDNILGDKAALREGNIEQYGKMSYWDAYSPYSRIADQSPLESRQNIRAILSLNWKIIKGLNYHTDFTLNRSWDQTKNWTGAVYNNYLDDATGEKLFAGAVDYRKSDSWGLRWSNVLNYELSFAKIHRINLLAGQEVTNSGGTDMRISANHYPANFSMDNAFAMINQYDQTAGTSAFSSGISTPGRILSYFGRANYTLNDRYLFTFTFRGDGSSRFAPSRRWGYFPAGAFAWKVSEESFMKNINWLSSLKLRLSYGEVGNDGISSNLWSQMWTSETDRRWQYVLNNQYKSAYDLASAQMANENLRWETLVTQNIGLDFGLFNNRVTGSIEVYKNTTKDLLMLTTIPGITGFTSTYANIGQTSNKGLELSLSGVILKNKDWNITAGANINFNKANVDKLAENVTGLYGTSWASSSTYPTNDYILKTGSPVGLVRGLVYDGFYTTDDFNYANGVYTLKPGVADVGSFIGVVHGVGTSERPSGQTAYPGVVKYKDLDGSGKIDDKDLAVIGDMTPKHTGGFNLSASFKNFDLGAYFNWSYGNDIYNITKLSSLYGYKETGVYENKLSIINNTYKIYDVVDGNLVRLNDPKQLAAANANASLPLAYNENGVTSSLGIEDGSYLRLNTLTMGYSVPKAILKKAGLYNLRIYGSVYNLFTITKYSGLDPEVNTNTSQNHAVYPTLGLDWNAYPRPRSFVVGLNLNF